ncbi:hypothetical protein L3V82_09500 [Thiotrichales bacterium 19S3-7]|nr:hypothetical protein [Thiotrichales bacterium 19S3-7]MCF6802392.1 hypothetical protein [Thiotrichales bacterium 19S3-11]
MQPTNFPFGKELRPYRYGEIETPFLTKTQMYDIPIGYCRHKAYFWRKVFFINLSVSILLILFFIMVISVRPFNIVVVSVTPQGHVRNVANLKLNQRYDIELYREYINSSMLSVLKEISQQPISKEAALQMNLIFTQKAKNSLEAFLEQNNVRNLFISGCQFKTQSNINCLVILNNNSNERYQAILNWQEVVPEEQQIKLNPLGLNIKSIILKPIEQLNEKGNNPNGLKEK